MSVVQSSLAAPDRFGGFSCLPRRAPGPLVFLLRRAGTRTYLGPGMGLSASPSPPAIAGGILLRRLLFRLLLLNLVYFASELSPSTRYTYPGPLSAPSPPLYAHRVRLRTRYSHDKREPCKLFSPVDEYLICLVLAYGLVLHY